MKKNIWLGLSLVIVMITTSCSLNSSGLKGSFMTEGGGIEITPSDTPFPTLACKENGSPQDATFVIANNAKRPRQINRIGVNFDGKGMDQFTVEAIKLVIKNSSETFEVPFQLTLESSKVVYFDLKEALKAGKIFSLPVVEPFSGIQASVLFTGVAKKPMGPQEVIEPIDVSIVSGEFQYMEKIYEYSDMQAPVVTVKMALCGAPQGQPGGMSSGPSTEKAAPTSAASAPQTPVKKCAYAAKNGIPGIGMPVLAKWKNGYQWYPGKISDYTEVGFSENVQQKDFSFSIDYDDGGKEDNLGCSQIAYMKGHPASVTPEQKVVIFSNDSNAYWSAHVVSFENGMVTVSYDDEPTKNKTVALSLVWTPLE